MVAENPAVDIPFLAIWENRPQPAQFCAWIWRAWEILSERRLILETGPQYIPLGEIAAYADYHKITRNSFREDLLAVVSALDRRWLAAMYKKREAARRKAEQEAKREGEKNRPRRGPLPRPRRR